VTFPDLFAYLGVDEVNPEHGIGLKQARVPAGMIPLVAVDREKLERVADAGIRLQAQRYGNDIYLVRYVAVPSPLVAIPGGRHA